MKKFFLLSILFSTILSFACAAEQNIEIKVWPKETIGPKETVKIVYRKPAAPNGTAILICPGGGYGILDSAYEGTDLMPWLMDQGITPFVLFYRAGPYLDKAPLEDALEAMTILRTRAEEFGINPNRIGIMGFDAGGHLASCVATHYNLKKGTEPNFQILIYPLITFGKDTHLGARNNFLGTQNITPENIKEFSNELHVTPQTCPAFVCHSALDQTIYVSNSQKYVEALKTNNVPVEYLELAQGAHGLGCGFGPEWKAWKDACSAWLIKNNLATNPAKKEK